MKKMKYLIASIWLALMAIASPIWLGVIYLDITGHSKGFGYDLGAEKDISIIFGIVELIIWLVAICPIVWLCKKSFFKKKILTIIPIFVFFIIFAIVVSKIGWRDYKSSFGM